jgi:hypothetical protein
LTYNLIYTQETLTSKIDGYSFTKVSALSRMLSGTQSIIALNSGNGNTTYDCGGTLFFAVKGNGKGRFASTGFDIRSFDPTEALDVTGNILASGSITGAELIYGTTNIGTKISKIEGDLNELQTDLTTKQDVIQDDDLSISKTFNLQSSLNDLQDNIELKQDMITTSTDLKCNSITTRNISVNTYFNTVVLRRFDEQLTPVIHWNEIQVWVNEVNIMINNELFCELCE